MNNQIAEEPATSVHYISEADTRWSRVNSVETFPGVARPLAWDLFGEGTNDSWRPMFEELGLVREGDALPAGGDAGYLHPFFGRSSINVDIVMACMDLFPGDKADDHARELFSEEGRQRAAADRSGIDLERFERYCAELTEIVAREHAELLAWWKASLIALERGDADPADLFIEARRRYTSAQKNHSANSTLSQQYFSMATKLAEACGNQHLASKLSTGFGDTFDTRSMAFLWKIGRGEAKMEDYLAEFGFQTSRGDDIFEPSWREDPSSLETLIKSFTKLPDEASPLSKEHERIDERSAAEAKIIEDLPADQRGNARDLLDRLANSIRHRELGKASYKIALDLGRAAARQRGAELQRDGFIDAPQDVFFLTQTEAMEREPEDFRNVIGARKTAHERYEALDIPTAWVGNPVPAFSEDNIGDGPVEGIGVSGGKVTGRIRVVLDHSSAEELEPGDILVTKTTDPSWGPFFMMAGGLVIDIGGPMSHGAIIARELGIPCVINTKDGSRRLPDGAMAEVDGDTGRVAVIGQSILA